jgi:hypothetical protein
MRVVGTDSSSNTQLALAAATPGLRPRYVCVNRPLANHIERVTPAGGRVATSHMLDDAFLRAQGFTPDYASPDMWIRWKGAGQRRLSRNVEVPRAERRRGAGPLDRMA